MRTDSRDGTAKGICRCLAAAVAAAAWAAAGEGLSLEDGFRSPPDTAKPHLWWHWMNGNVTKEGITADLESMAAEGHRARRLQAGRGAAEPARADRAGGDRNEA